MGFWDALLFALCFGWPSILAYQTLSNNGPVIGLLKHFVVAAGVWFCYFAARLVFGDSVLLCIVLCGAVWWLMGNGFAGSERVYRKLQAWLDRNCRSLLRFAGRQNRVYDYPLN
jgi:hypothetical protein